ncbi:MAG TPA: IS1182 family transposase [Candidatus Deferrimicrobium sp.]|nr:IS1182 family transposase [Candidatus Deferrimicrobium sp.]
MIYRREDVGQLGFSCLIDEVATEPLILTIDRFVEQLDLTEFHARYSEAGTGYYDPGMLLKVWFFAYCDRTWQSRSVASRVKYDVRYRYFVGSHRPDFRTLNRFRHDHMETLGGVFASLVAHCEHEGLIDSSVVALDGTKLRANASGRKQGKDLLREVISRRLRHDVQADGNAEESGDTIIGDPELSTEASRMPEKIATDSGARFMKTGEGTIRLCYNAQVVVDNNQIIWAADVRNEASDQSSLAPMVEQATHQVSSPLGAIVADGGYYSGRNVQYAHENGLDVYLPKGKDERQVYSQERFVYDSVGDRYQCPNGRWLKGGQQRWHRDSMKTIYRSTAKQCQGCALKTACTRQSYRRLEVAATAVVEYAMAMKLASPEGRAIYARRRELVEPVFGDIKFNLDFTRFSLRGLAKVRDEFLLLGIAHNLRKLAHVRDTRWGFAAAHSIFTLILASYHYLQTLVRPISGNRWKNRYILALN